MKILYFAKNIRVLPLEILGAQPLKKPLKNPGGADPYPVRCFCTMKLTKMRRGLFSLMIPQQPTILIRNINTPIPIKPYPR